MTYLETITDVPTNIRELPDVSGNILHHTVACELLDSHKCSGSTGDKLDSEEMKGETIMNLKLERDALDNDDDVSGRWQYEGGKVFEDGRQVGYYASTKRVEFKATDAENTAMLTMTLFFLPSKPPENITVQGSHDFNSGGQVGSVSAASTSFASHIGKKYTRTGDIVTIG